MMDEIEATRAGLYRMLGMALAAPPEQPLLEVLRGLSGGAGEIARCLSAIAAAARGATLSEAVAEYNALFIGVIRGELVPYASYYLTGYLYDRPLARLREDMARHGLEAADGRTDPEDHVATVLEVMGLLIERGTNVPDQHGYFRRHVEPWAGRFFSDLENATAARLYRPIADLGRHLIAIESDAFELEVAA